MYSDKFQALSKYIYILEEKKLISSDSLMLDRAKMRVRTLIMGEMKVHTYLQQ